MWPPFHHWFDYHLLSGFEALTGLRGSRRRYEATPHPRFPTNCSVGKDQTKKVLLNTPKLITGTTGMVSLSS